MPSVGRLHEVSCYKRLPSWVLFYYSFLYLFSGCNQSQGSLLQYSISVRDKEITFSQCLTERLTFSPKDVSCTHSSFFDAIKGGRQSQKCQNCTNSGFNILLPYLPQIVEFIHIICRDQAFICLLFTLFDKYIWSLFGLVLWSAPFALLKFC